MSPLRRVSVTVPIRRAEEARATMLELFPEGFEEVESADDVELSAYTDASGEERLWHVFGSTRSAEVGEGWEQQWRRFHRPVRIGPLWVGPPWEDAPEGLLAIVIEPGRAFGTGGHATTRLCLELLLELDAGSLLDVGCGSGVLSIAAARLGFAPVTALDADPLAVEATARNAAANGVSVDVLLADGLHDTLPPAEAAVANITLQSVRELAPRLRCRRLVSSGYLVADPLDLPGYRRARRLDAEGWAADLWEAETE
jgi:ribosomal protein L11 methyltransferase